MKKRLFAALITICMLVTLLPVSVFAAYDPQSIVSTIQSYNDNLRRFGGNGQLTATVSGSTVTISGTVTNAGVAGTLRLDGDKASRINWNASLTGSCSNSYTLVELTGKSDFTVGTSGKIHNTNTQKGYALYVTTDYSAGYADVTVNGQVISDSTAVGTSAIYFSNNGYIDLTINRAGVVRGGYYGVGDSGYPHVNRVTVNGTLEGGVVALPVGSASNPTITVIGTVRSDNLAISLGTCGSGTVNVTSSGTVDGGIATSASTGYEGDGVEITVSGDVYAHNRPAISVGLAGSVIEVTDLGSVVSTSGPAVQANNWYTPGYWDRDPVITLKTDAGSFLAGAGEQITEDVGKYPSLKASLNGVAVLLDKPLAASYDEYTSDGIQVVSPEEGVHAYWINSSVNSNGYIEFRDAKNNTFGTALIPGASVKDSGNGKPVYSITLDPNGGTLTVESPMETDPKDGTLNINLGLTGATRPGYKFLGFYDAYGHKVDWDTIFAGDATVTAKWEELHQTDISDQITFTAKKDTSVYTGSEQYLTEFINKASFSGGAITYTLSKDGGPAQAATLTTPVTDVGTYTVTAQVNTDAYIGSKSLTFTITKADVTIDMDKQSITVVAGTDATVAVSASLSGTVLPLSASSADEKIATAVTYGNGAMTVTGVAVGKTTITVSFAGNDNINPAQKTLSVEVIALPKQDVTFADPGDKTVTYGDASFTNAAENKTQGGGALSYDSSNKAVATVDSNGQVTIKAAGETVITATAAGMDDQYAQTQVSYTLTVAPKAIAFTVEADGKTFDGKTDAQVTVTFDSDALVGGDVLQQGKDYTVSAAFADANAGQDKTVSGTVTMNNGNYTVADGGAFTAKATIAKAAAQVLEPITATARYTDTQVQTVSLDGMLPENAGTVTYQVDDVNDIYQVNHDTALFSVQPAVSDDGKLTFTLADGLTTDALGKQAEITLSLNSANYESSQLKVEVNITDRYTPVVTTENITLTYTGKPVADSAIQGTATFNGETVEGTWAFQAGSAVTNVADSGAKVVIFTPADQTTYVPVEATIQVTIQKADPTGEPAYTAIEDSGKTLADAALTVGTITPAGTIAWDLPADTEVKGNTEYTWTFTPDDTANYNILAGTITPYVRYSSGSSTSYAIDDQTDGRGDITLSASKAVRGTTITITVEPDEGYELAELTVTDGNGNALRLTDKGSGKFTFTMPSSDATVKASFQKADQPEEQGFTDVDDDAYYYDAVNWAVENGVTSGTSATTFSPNAGCTRGQVMTFLWSAMGRPQVKAAENPFTDVASDDYYYDAVLWAVANGITSGTSATTFSPNAVCTRAQIVTFLWQAMEHPEVKSAENPFTDVASDAYYYDAVLWAVENGITGGTSATTFSPNATCTRAQVVTFLFQMMEG